MPLSLAEIHRQWNELAPLARSRGINPRLAADWAVPPHNIDYGMMRLNRLRGLLGMPAIMGAPTMDPGSMSHRQIQAEFNALVPLAHARGIRAVIWTRPAPSRARGMRALNALKAKLGDTTGLVMPAEAVAWDDAWNDYTYGLELELYMPPGMGLRNFEGHKLLARKLTTACGFRVEFEGWNHTPKPYWRVTSDGSLGDYLRGAEVVAPIFKGARGLNEAKAICVELTRIGCTVRKKCGYHVHVRPSVWTADHLRNIALVYDRFEPVIDSIMIEDRRGFNCDYARPHKLDRAVSYADRTTIREALMRAPTAHAVAKVMAPAGGNSERFYKLNFASYWRHDHGGTGGTVEYRQHSGTVDHEQVLNWARMCLRLSEAARDGNIPVLSADVTLDGLLGAVKADGNEAAYFHRRLREVTRRPVYATP